MPPVTPFPLPDLFHCNDDRCKALDGRLVTRLVMQRWEKLVDLIVYGAQRRRGGGGRTGNAATTKHGARRQKPRRISMEGLQRAMSDLALELARDRKQSSSTADAATTTTTNNNTNNKKHLPSITEQQQQVENARCECCGMQEECTPAYVRRVREPVLRALGVRAVRGGCQRRGGDAARRAHGGGAGGAHGRVRQVQPRRPRQPWCSCRRRPCGRSSGRGPGPIAPGTTSSDPAGSPGAPSCIPAITKDFN
ncbi:hypothetical protein PR202_ga24077 [Eleusine coracana subsp. coracana]|uniref:Uncharacterized protein n=1 Tax=Eleusine coracana subsp. coracana TaxID=191504 RepID=A0AAV5D8H9_ELECO|nr:hypothetical protein PR202_ga24077 [Eleusine coracana subsp. coracana]